MPSSPTHEGTRVNWSGFCPSHTMSGDDPNPL